jgi:hypothetical protein
MASHNANCSISFRSCCLNDGCLFRFRFSFSFATFSLFTPERGDANRVGADEKDRVKVRRKREEGAGKHPRTGRIDIFDNADVGRATIRL